MFNSVFHFFIRVLFRIQLYYLGSMSLMDFCLHFTRLVRCMGLILCPFKIDIHLHDRLLFEFILLCHMYVGYTKIFLCERLSFNLFSRTFEKFTIVVLILYDFTPYSIVLPISISSLVLIHWIICFRCLFYVAT